jgi:hypothetical protein
MVSAFLLLLLGELVRAIQTRARQRRPTVTFVATHGADALYGRSETEWDELTSEGLRFLVDQARLQRTTTYTELDTVLSRRTAVCPFDFDLDSERAAMGQLLYRIVEAERAASGTMISTIVIYLNKAGAPLCPRCLSGARPQSGCRQRSPSAMQEKPSPRLTRPRSFRHAGRRRSRIQNVQPEPRFALTRSEHISTVPVHVTVPVAIHASSPAIS